MFISILGKPPGYDRVRNAEIGNKDFELDVFKSDLLCFCNIMYSPKGQI
jgi:hypothetical protein